VRTRRRFVFDTCEPVVGVEPVVAEQVAPHADAIQILETSGVGFEPRFGRRQYRVHAVRIGRFLDEEDRALAMVVVEASGRPLVVSNADLTSTRAGGLQSDLAATFLDELADAAGLTIHVRLIEGKDSQHVLSAIFKALGIALANATRGES